MAEIDYINIDYKKLDKKILETEIKIFRFYRQCKLLFYCLRELNNHEVWNIENIQKIEKKAEFCKNIIPGLSVPNNLFLIVSEADRALAAVSEK